MDLTYNRTIDPTSPGGRGARQREILSLLFFVALTVQAAADAPAELRRWFVPQDWKRDVAGPIVSLGKSGEFDNAHIFAPAVAEEQGKFLLWYCGSRGSPTSASSDLDWLPAPTASSLKITQEIPCTNSPMGRIRY